MFFWVDYPTKLQRSIPIKGCIVYVPSISEDRVIALSFDSSSVGHTLLARVGALHMSEESAIVQLREVIRDVK